MATDVTVVIPFGGADPHREAALEHVRDFYRYEFPDWTVRLGYDDDTRVFSRARACNNGANDATEGILIINDADTLCPPNCVREAVALATAEPGLVRAYTRYRRLSQSATASVTTYKEALAATDAMIEWQQDVAYAHGCAVTRVECWHKVGGYDPRFEGWGYEDCAAELIFNAHWPDRRVAGDLIHLWHPGGWNFDDEHRNSKLYHERYEQLSGCADDLIALRFADD